MTACAIAFQPNVLSGAVIPLRSASKRNHFEIREAGVTVNFIELTEAVVSMAAAIPSLTLHVSPRETIEVGRYERLLGLATASMTPASLSLTVRVPLKETVVDAASEADSAFLDSQESDAWKSYRSLLLTSLEDEPVEDGASHPAEDLLLASIGDWPYTAPSRILTIFRELADRPSQAAGLLKCVGRLEFGRVATIGECLVLEAIQNSSAEVREAAISAVEHWSRRELVEALRQHEEPLDWLRGYLRKVIADLS